MCGGESTRGAEGGCVAFDTGSSLGLFGGHSKPITCVAYRSVAPFRIITGSEDTSVVFHEGPPFKFMRSCSNSHTGFVNAVAFTADGSKALSCGNDGIVAVYSGETGELNSQLDPRLSCSIWGLDLDATGTVYIACGDKKLRVISNNTVVGELTVRDGQVKDMPVGIACDRKRGKVHAIALDGTLLHYEIDSSGHQLILDSVSAGSQSAITAIESCREGIYVMSLDGKVWSVSKPYGKSSPTFEEWKKPFKASAAFLFCGGGPLIGVSASVDAELVSISPSGESVSFGPCPAGISRLVPTREAGLGVAIGEKSTVYAILRLGAFIETRMVKSPITALSVSGDGSTVAFVCEREGSGSLTSQNAFREFFVNGSPVVTEMNIADIVQIAVSTDGSLIAVASGAQELHVYRGVGEKKFQVDLETVKAWTYHKARILAMVWVANRFLVTAGMDKAIYVWDIQKAISGPIASLKDAHKEGVCALYAELADPSLLTIVSGGLEGSVKVTEIRIVD